MKSKNKIYFIILFIFITANVIIYLYDIVYTQNSSFLILDYDNSIQIHNNKYSINKNIVKKLNGSQMTLLDKIGHDGYLDIKNNEETLDNYVTFFDKSMEEVSQSYESIIISNNSNIKNYSYLISYEITEGDIKNIEKYLKQNNLGTYTNHIDVTKASLPNNKILYSIKSISPSSSKENNYAVIFILDGSEFYTVYTKTNIEIKTKSSSINKLVDINNDNNIDLILSSSKYASDNESCYSLYIYNAKTNSYDPKINCEGDE